MLAGLSLRAVRESLTKIVLWAIVAVIVAGLAYYTGSSVLRALMGACAVFGLGLLAVDMVLLPVVALPGMLVLQRVGGTLSGSDLILFCATLIALLYVRLSESPELRQLLWAVVAYQACLIPTLIQNRYTADVVEWWHELLLVGGGLVTGWAIGRMGRGRLALGLYVAPVCVLAALACLAAPARHFHPFNFWVYQKNALGDMFAFAGAIAYTRPAWLRWPASLTNLIVVVCGLGALAVGSRQGVISLVAAIAVVTVRGRVTGRRSRLILLASIPLLAVAYTVTADQLQSHNKFNSAHQRLSWYGDSIDVWRHARWLGVGLRWWYTARFTQGFQPPNAELEMLTSAGIVGCAAFLITLLVMLRVLWRMDPVYGLLPFTIVVVRFVQGQLDLYWVASASSLPWLVVGIGLGVQSMVRAREAGQDGAGQDGAKRPSRSPSDAAPPPGGPPDRRSRSPRRPTPLPAGPSGR